MTDPNSLPTPDFIDIDEETQKAAQAAMSRNRVLTPPDNATVSVDKKTGDVYKRWTEAATIEETWREPAAGGLVVAVVQLKIRAGMPNEHERAWARHILNIGVLAGSGTDEEKKKYQSMNDRSINAITTLLNATGYAPNVGGLTGKMLNFMFPVKNQPGMKAPISGKSVMINIIDQPNKGAKATTPRQTGVESYLPDA